MIEFCPIICNVNFAVVLLILLEDSLSLDKQPFPCHCFSLIILVSVVVDTLKTILNDVEFLR